MTALANLLPCPFCGTPDIEAYPADRERNLWNVCCGNPGCVTRGDNDYLSEADAIAAWNRRATLSPAELGGVEEMPPLPKLPPCITRLKVNDAPLFDAFQMHQYAIAYAEAALSTPRADEAEWTDEQCLKFLSIAFRHGDFSGVTPDDIRMAVKMTAALSPPSPGAAK